MIPVAAENFVKNKQHTISCDVRISLFVGSSSNSVSSEAETLWLNRCVLLMFHTSVGLQAFFFFFKSSGIHSLLKRTHSLNRAQSTLRR